MEPKISDPRQKRKKCPNCAFANAHANIFTNFSLHDLHLSILSAPGRQLHIMAVALELDSWPCRWSKNRPIFSHRKPTAFGSLRFQDPAAILSGRRQSNGWLDAKQRFGGGHDFFFFKKDRLRSKFTTGRDAKREDFREFYCINDQWMKRSPFFEELIKLCIEVRCDRLCKPSPCDALMIWYFGFSPYVMLLAPSIYCFFFLAESRSFRLCAATKLHCSSDSTWDTCYTWWMQCGAKLQTLGSQCQVDWNRSVETPWAGKSILSTLQNALPVFFASVAATSLNQKSLSAKEPQIPIDWTLRAAI